MDFTAFVIGQDASALVVWFALLVVVFAVFVGLGIYHGRRTEALERDAELRASAHASAKPASPVRSSDRHTQRVQHTQPARHTNTHRKEFS